MSQTEPINAAAEKVVRAVCRGLVHLLDKAMGPRETVFSAPERPRPEYIEKDGQTYPVSTAYRVLLPGSITLATGPDGVEKAWQVLSSYCTVDSSGERVIVASLTDGVLVEDADDVGVDQDVNGNTYRSACLNMHVVVSPATEKWALLGRTH